MSNRAIVSYAVFGEDHAVRGAIVDEDSASLWECSHEHNSSGEAMDCAWAELRRRMGLGVVSDTADPREQLREAGWVSVKDLHAAYVETMNERDRYEEVLGACKVALVSVMTHRYAECSMGGLKPPCFPCTALSHFCEPDGIARRVVG